MPNPLDNVLIDELEHWLAPLLDAAHSPTTRRRLFAALGWEIDAIPGVSLQRLERAIAAVVDAYEDVRELLEMKPEDRSFETLKTTIDTIDSVWQAVEELHSISTNAGAPELAQLQSVGQELINFLTCHYLRSRYPALYELAILLTLVRIRESNAMIAVGNPPVMIRRRFARPEIRLDRIIPLLRDPVGYLRGEYLGEEGLETAADAQRLSDRVFPHIGGFFGALGAHAFYGRRNAEGLDFGPLGNELIPRTLTIAAALPTDDSGLFVSAGSSFALSSPDRGDLGLVVVPYASVDYARGFVDWALRLRVSANVAAFAVGPHGLTLIAPPEVAGVVGELTATSLPNDAGSNQSQATPFVLGGAGGTRIELGGARASLFWDLDTAQQDFGFLVSLDRAALVLAAGDGDAFFEKMVRSTIRTEFAFEIGWSKRRGLMLGGDVGLEVTIPVHKSLFGAVTIDSVHLGLQPMAGETSALRIEVSTTGSLQLGPIATSIDRVGITTTLAFPEGRGNLGPLHVSGFPTFKPPQAIGLVIDAGTIVGGGFLFFDSARNEYGGILQLEFEDTISLKAIGLLTTRMPNGARGFSLVIIISAEGFTPIPLGYGFTLNGVGGLIGVNRTVALPVLRAGIKQGTLNSILFPPDPIRNAPQIISDLRAVFPPAEGRYVFGPMAIIGWGTPTLLTLELAVILELPAPVRMVILGRLRALLPVPKEDVALVRVQMDALGTVDFDSGNISLDATLYDSRLLQYTLSGDMALRANVGASPAFVLAIGGFHPKFEAPPAFPSLDRIAIALATGNNPRIELEAYLALTANTAQFGARLSLYARQGGFSIEGSLGFDALFQFDPFQFVADVGGRVTVRRGRRKLTTVKIDMTLTGPTPLHASGKAKFKVLGVKHTVRFSGTFGGDDRPAVPAASVDVTPKIVEAVTNPRNWSGQLPADAHPIVTIREREIPGAVRVHPLATLTLRQRVVPLGLTISRFGQARATGTRRFAITRVELAGQEVTPEPVRDHFAPAQFLEMTDDEKLASPSFESFQAGIALGRGALDYGIEAGMTAGYKTMVIDPRQEPVVIEAPALTPAAAGSQNRFGAAARSQLGRSGRSKYRAPRRAVSVSEPTYIVTTTDTGEREAIAGLGAAARLPYAEALDILRAHVAAHPQDRERLQVRAARSGEAA